MELDKFLIGILVFTAIVVGGTLIIANMNANYADVMTENLSTDDFGEVYDTTDEIYNISQDMKDGILGGEVDEDDTADSMFKGAYKTLRFIQASFELVGNIISAVATKIGIPVIFVTLALAALAISIVFGILYLIFRVAKG